MVPTHDWFEKSEAQNEMEWRERLRACLVSNRVGLGGAESASFTRGTASRGRSLHGGFFGFRSVSSK